MTGGERLARALKDWVKKKSQTEDLTFDQLFSVAEKEITEAAHQKGEDFAFENIRTRIVGHLGDPLVRTRYGFYKGQLDCDQQSDVILTEELCEVGAPILQDGERMETVSDSELPFGCYSDGKTVFFNASKSTSAEYDHKYRAVCKEVVNSDVLQVKLSSGSEGLGTEPYKSEVSPRMESSRIGGIASQLNSIVGKRTVVDSLL